MCICFYAVSQALLVGEDKVVLSVHLECYLHHLFNLFCDILDVCSCSTIPSNDVKTVTIKTM